MPMLRGQKEAKVAEIKANIKKAQSFVLIDYKGLTVAEDVILRKAFREAGVTYRAYKNRLMKIALNDLGRSEFDESLIGATAIAMGTEDLAAPARIAFEKSALFKKLVIKCGFADGRFLDADACKTLSTLPDRAGLLSQIVGLLQAPIAGLARCLAAVAENKA